jgi:glycosyltransferase 2 family protein
VATALLLVWLARTADWKMVGPTLVAASPLWLLAAAGCYLASQFASVARWWLLVRAGDIASSFPQLLSVYFEGMFVNLCLPTSIGGDLLKVLRIGGASDKKTAATTVVADRASGIVALVVLLGLGLLLRYRGGLPGFVVPLAVVGLVMLELIVLVGGRFALPKFAKSENIVGRSLWAVPLITEAPWPRVLGWALVVQSLNVAAVAAAAKAIGISITAAGLLIATEMASLAAALPLSVAGIGVREASLPMLLAADGVPRSAAIALGLTWSAIVLLVGLLGALGHIVEQRKSAHAKIISATLTADVPRPNAAA